MFSKKQADASAADKLRGVSFFDGFSDDELGRIAEMAEDVEAEQGAVLIDQGRVGRECYVILEGKASVYAGDEHIATLEPGSMVGEMALVDHRPRNASVVADTPMTLIGFDTKHFRQLLEEFPEANDRVIALLTARLKARADTD